MYNGVTSEFTYGADGLRRSMTVGGANWYAYCRNNPVNLVDPDGLIPGADEVLFLIGYADLSVSMVALVLFWVALATAADSLDVEMAWGRFMHWWSGDYMGISGDVMFYANLVNEILNVVLPSSLPSDVGATQAGMKLSVLAMGYKSRIEYYIRQIDF